MYGGFSDAAGYLRNSGCWRNHQLVTSQKKPILFKLLLNFCLIYTVIFRNSKYYISARAENINFTTMISCISFAVVNWIDFFVRKGKVHALLSSFYRFDIALNYHSVASILLAINIAPILIFVWLNRVEIAYWPICATGNNAVLVGVQKEITSAKKYWLTVSALALPVSLNVLFCYMNFM